MTKDLIYSFLIKHNLSVISTSSPDQKPEAALIGFAVTENLEIVFDTLKISRKYQNLLTNPFVALVIGWEDEITLQYEGIATELLSGIDDDLKETYYTAFNDGRERAVNLPHITHFKITPKWIRYSNYNSPVIIEEIAGPFL